VAHILTLETLLKASTLFKQNVWQTGLGWTTKTKRQNEDIVWLCVIFVCG